MNSKRFFLPIFSAFFTAAAVFSLTEPFNNKPFVSAQGDVPAAKAECVMELHSRRILYQSHGDIRLPMASTTKILTAATVLENCTDIQQEIAIPDEAVGVEGSSVYLKSGDVYSVEELLYGLMLRSGNDCATALALHCCGTVADFSAKMNETAQKAGALDSNFKNPHGLPCNGHYTTAKDLGLIACYAMQNKTFSKIVSTSYYAPRHWKNKNKMLALYDGAIGVKTGYTKEAGRCLVSAAKRENTTLICVVLQCANTYERSMALLNDAFNAYKNVTLIQADTPIELNKDGKRILACTRREYSYPLLPEEVERIEIKTRLCKEKNKEIVGQFEIYLAKQLLFSGNLYKL